MYVLCGGTNFKNLSLKFLYDNKNNINILHPLTLFTDTHNVFLVFVNSIKMVK